MKTISLAQLKRLSGTLQAGYVASSTRKRNGKKRRVAVRKKAAIKEVREISARSSKAEAEAAEKEKRTRKNREKKVKKRQRDKLKKASVTTEAG